MLLLRPGALSGKVCPNTTETAGYTFASCESAADKLIPTEKFYWKTCTQEEDDIDAARISSSKENLNFPLLKRFIAGVNFSNPIQ